MNSIIGNEEIYGYSIVLVDESGTNRGEMIKKAAIFSAKEKGLDLIQVGKTDKGLAICKYGDLGKLKFEASKKKVVQKQIETKEMMFHITTSVNDILVKKNKIRVMLSKGHMVRFGIELKGRERAFMDNAKQLLKNSVADLSNVATWDDMKVSNNVVFVLLKPTKEVSHVNLDGRQK